MRKYILIGSAAAVVLLLGLVVTLVLSIDSIIERAVNDYGPRVTQTDVSLGSADIGIFSGSGELNGLIVGNPVNRGFKPKNLFSMDQIRVTLDTDSLTTDTIVIKEVNILSPSIAYERGEGGQSNFEALLRNIEESTGMDKQAPAEEQPAAQEGRTAGRKKIIIDNLVITNAEVNADMTGMPGEGITLPIPDIHLTGIGREDGGATPAETAEIVMSAVYDSMRQAFADSSAFIMKGGQWVMDQGAAAAEGAGKMADDAAKSVGDSVGGALEGVGKMFE